MSIALSTTAPRVTFRSADDPFKKYWWAILAAFAFLALWICWPAMESPIGSERVSRPQPRMDKSAEQDLSAAADARSGGGAAPAADASVKTAFTESESPGLYRAPDEAPAAAAPASNGGAALAQALKDAARAAPARADSSGWSGERAQRGFSSPHLGASSLAGVGTVAGSANSSASMSAPSNFFGSGQSHPVFGPSSDGHQSPPAASGGSLSTLRRSADMTVAASGHASADAAANGVSRTFDGAGTRNQIGFSGRGASVYSQLDSAPANLKVNDPKLDTQKKYSDAQTPPTAPAPPSKSNIGQQIAMTMVGAVLAGAVGGLIPGVAGQVIGMGMMMGLQQVIANQNTKNDQNLNRNQQNGNRLNIPTS